MYINYLVSEPNYHTSKLSVYLSLSVLEISKTVMYEFSYDYVKPKYNQEAQLCYMDTDNFIFHVKTEDVKDVKKTFDTSNYESQRPLPKGKIKKIIGLMKDELRKNDKRTCRIKSKNVKLFNR